MGIWIGVGLLTIINMAVFWYSYKLAPKRRLNLNLAGWRVSLAIAPTPMLGVAGSYGVYAFNVIFMPWQWAVVMASALELTYIGLACLDGLTPEQRTRAQQVAMRAAWISYAENVLAGLFYALPALVAEINSWWLWWQVLIWLPLAALHGSLVYVGFTVTNLTLHRPDAQAQPKAATRTTPAVTAPKLAQQPLAQVVYPAPVPVRQSYAENMANTGMPDLPPLPETAMDLTNQLADYFGDLAEVRKRTPVPAPGYVAPHAPRRNFAGTLAPLPLPDEDASTEDKAAWVRAMVDERGYKQADCARLLGKSRPWIGDLYHGRYQDKKIGGTK